MSRRLLVFLVLLAATAGWAHLLRSRQSAVQHAADLASIPIVLGPRAGIDQTYDARTLSQLRSDVVLARQYHNPLDESSIQLFIAYFGSQETGSQIHSPQNCLPGGGYVIAHRDRWTVRSESGPREVNEYIIEKDAGRQIIQYWFITRSGILANEFELKLDLVRNALLGRPTDAAFVRLARGVGPEGLESARQDIRGFCGSIQPILDRAIPIASRSK